MTATLTTLDLQKVILELESPEHTGDTVPLSKDLVRSLVVAVNGDQVKADTEALKRINSSFTGMPYGGPALLTYAHGLGSLLTLEQIADNLARLRDTLEEVYDDHEHTRTELARYRQVAAAARTVAAFLGGRDAD